MNQGKNVPSVSSTRLFLKLRKQPLFYTPELYIEGKGKGTVIPIHAWKKCSHNF